MALAEVAVICLSFVSCVGICAGAYYLAEQRKAQITSDGVTKRAMMKLGNPSENNATSTYGKQEWWVPMATELLKNPQIQNMILSKVAPTLTQQPQTVSE